MRGDITYKILSLIAKGLSGFGDAVGAVLKSPYGASFSRLEYEARKLRSARERVRVESASKQRFRNILSKLKREGLIVVENQNFALTPKGKRKLEQLASRKIMPPNSYDAEHSEFVTIVSFDVPEKERRKRNWLREALRNMDLVMVQQSFWMGKVKIPEDFLYDLRRLDLLDAVEIFQVTKGGTLKNII